MYPLLFKLGPLSIYSYGVLLATAYIVGLQLALRRADRAGLSGQRVMDLGIFIIISALVGAKLMLFIVEFKQFTSEPARLMVLLKSGGVFYGGLLAALAVAILYAKKVGLPWLPTADALAPGAAIGHSIGRLGCFAAGCCWGQETDVPWAVTFTDAGAHEFTGVPLGLHLHPTQLYEAFGTALIGLYLLRTFRKPHASGSILGRYLLLYSAFRFCVEFFREDGARTILVGGIISTTQIVAVALVALGAYIWITTSRKEASPA